ncbi:helix-turn-helix transcriptional regulator [Paenibacillus sp. FSL R7-0337]|uniref:helix-turn-helix transcriptional regulator n=1 Tax=Paenibacillus sp. FSL R7-0337 TaxID=1926588 RepID=UPI00096BE6D1|nr:helix-turn-helix transcriptional regulator [Paenibacillus sp. FSL R7-0337]OMF98210.1 hypothetical protein BK147_11360 [Paenibacillus sp. FSL R7-0337]
MEIVDNIKNLCSKNGMTIPKLEKELGFGNGTIYNWIKSSPSLEKLQKVASYFKVTIDDLVGWGHIYNLGSYIEDEREAQNLSLEDLSTAIKISQESLSQIENNKIPLTSELLEHITSSLGMTVQEFLIKYEMYEDAITQYYKGDIKAYLEYLRHEEKNNINKPIHEDEDWTAKELEELEQFKQFLRMKRSTNK